MNWDEFSFVNQQLAGMLKSGIPLEGGLRQVCTSMRRGELRTELELLEADLGRGVPLKDALSARKLPAFYVSMVRAGAQSGDLPGVLLIVADYYARLNTLWTRLKGLLVYPAIVLTLSLLLTGFFSYGIKLLLMEFETDLGMNLQAVPVMIWYLPSLFVVLLGLICVVTFLPSARRSMRWKIPGFQEASLCAVASTLSLLLKGGNSLQDSLRLVGELEADSPAGREIEHWQKRLAQGHSKFPDIAAPSATFPPLFIWLAATGGEDLAGGFARAGDIYFRRAIYRSEMFLYAALPVGILALGVLIIGQTSVAFRALIQLMDAIGGV